jgi:hypothetical protein
MSILATLWFWSRFRKALKEYKEQEPSLDVLPDIFFIQA